MQAKPNKKPTRSQARSAARQLTMQAVYQWQLNGNSMQQVELQMRAALPDDKLEGDEDISNVLKVADLAYFHQLTQGIAQQEAELDASFEGFLDRRLQDLDPIELAILRLGAYELKERLDVPYRVVINEGVELAKSFGATASHKFINGILDKLAQQLRQIEIQAQQKKRS